MLLKPPARWVLFTTLFLFLCSACRTKKVLAKKGLTTFNLEQAIENGNTINGLTGFLIMDQATSDIIYEKNADTYFTPASNVKILTLYTALKVLDLEVPGLKYAETSTNDIFIQGTGHPALLNPAFPTDKNSVFDFLQKQNNNITFCDCNFQDDKYGSGWSWDDYYYYFQSEKSPLPIYGNNVRFSKPSRTDSISASPFYFKNNIQVISDTSVQKLKITRNWDDNQFSARLPPNSSFTKKDRPFRSDQKTIAQLLSDTLSQNIQTCNNNCTKRDFRNIKSNTPTEELYKELMQPSDNFIAEQLLLLCANQLFDTLNVGRTIEWAQDSLFQFLPQAPKWVDGSGLSRYNMITPRSMVAVLNQLYLEYPEPQLFELFPTGGESGTIKDWYGGLGKPYVFAKTGTLRHIHCLSGYLVTKRGKRLVFSFMHNNYVGSMRYLKKEMERVLQLVYVSY